MCQKTVVKRYVVIVVLGDMSIINMAFRKVAVSLIEPISPESDEGHRYILTLIKCATK